MSLKMSHPIIILLEYYVYTFPRRSSTFLLIYTPQNWADRPTISLINFAFIVINFTCRLYLLDFGANLATHTNLLDGALMEK